MITVRYGILGVMKRIVLPKIKYKIVYDWVGSLDETPTFFNLYSYDFTLHIEETNQAVEGRGVKDVL